jgi:hypothetical protein
VAALGPDVDRHLSALRAPEVGEWGNLLWVHTGVVNAGLDEETRQRELGFLG